MTEYTEPLDKPAMVAPVVTLRLSPVMLQKVHTLIGRDGLTRSEVIRGLIAAGLRSEAGR
jgi:hypothetical protein